MDLEQLKRINTLSHELIKHGFTQSSEEAYNQAEKAIRLAPKTQVAVQEQSTEVPTAASALAERKFQVELERVTKQVNQELNVFRDSVNNIITELNSLKEEVGKLKTTQPPKKKEKQISFGPEQKTIQQPKEKHPKQGGFDSQDVDINKMFYFGNK